MSGLAILTLVHVALSLVGIGTGFVVMYGFLTRNLRPRWNSWFLATTLLTSVTGFFFPVHRFLPSHAVGILSLVILGVAYFALYSQRSLRKTYVITASLAQYLNVFVLFVQLFQKVPALKALAPTQSEPAFKVTQLAVLVIFFAFTVVAARRAGRDTAPEVKRKAAA